MKQFLQEIGLQQVEPTTFYSNSQSAIALSVNPKFHSRSKHVDTQYHFTWEKLQAKHIQLTYISIVEMIIDILTKSLPKEKHFHPVSNLGMEFVYPSNDFPHSQPISHALMAYVGVSSHKHNSSIKNIPPHPSSSLTDPKSLKWERSRHWQQGALKTKTSCTSSFIEHKYRNYLPIIGTSSYSWLDRVESPNGSQEKIVPIPTSQCSNINKNTHLWDHKLETWED